MLINFWNYILGLLGPLSLTRYFYSNTVVRPEQRNCTNMEI